MKKEVGNEITKRPKIGVGVIIYNSENKVLLGQRKNSHGAGDWAFPGGHLEFGEAIEDCARREVLEETGIQITDLYPAAFTNDLFSEEKHYVTLFIAAKHQAGVVRNMEPDKCERWEWFSPDAFPKPLFLTLQNLAKQDFKYEYGFKSLR